MSAGLIKLDSQKRVSLGKYTPLQPGEYLQIERLDDGTLVLRPARLQPALDTIPSTLHEGERVITGSVLRGLRVTA